MKVVVKFGNDTRCYDPIPVRRGIHVHHEGIERFVAIFEVRHDYDIDNTRCPVDSVRVHRFSATL